MENRTRFDLNAAIENWRQELAAQPNLATDDRRELETHLRDAIIGFRQRGLNDEESFWLARRRVGRTEQLAEEYVKTESTPIWCDLKKPVFNSRQFIGLLLVLFTTTALIIAAVDAFHPPDMTLEGMTPRWQADVNNAEEFGFLLPSLHSFLAPLVGVIVFLTAVNFWLCVRKSKVGTQNRKTPKRARVRSAGGSPA